MTTPHSFQMDQALLLVETLRRNNVSTREFLPALKFIEYQLAVDGVTLSERQGRRSERRASNLFTIFLTFTSHLERLFQILKRQVPSFGVNSHPSVQNRSTFQLIYHKRAQKKRVVEVTRTMSHGSQEEAERLLQQSRGGNVLNTAFMATLECHDASATCHLNTQMPSRCSPPASTRDGNVSAWDDLQSLLVAPRALQADP